MLEDRFHRLTGAEFFRFKSWEKLKGIFSPLVTRLNSKMVFTIGGTNGKGEVSYCLDYMLNLQGCSVGTFTSPHLACISERFRLNGRKSTIDEVAKALDCFEKQYPSNSIELSYFELCFWVFLYLCKKNEIDFLVLEVGLGGRLDITNLIDADVTVITNISRDHIDILGNSYKKILKEKLGITREKAPLITGVQLDWLKKDINKYSKEKNFPVTYVDFEKNFSYTNRKAAFEAFKQANIKNENRITFSDICQNLCLDPRMICKKVGGVKINFFGAHNLDGHRKLVKSFMNSGRSFDAVLINFSNRSYDEMKSILKIYTEMEETEVFLER